MKQKNEKQLEPTLNEQDRKDQIFANVAIGCIWVSITSATLIAMDGVSMEAYDLQRNNPYDFFGLSVFFTSQEGYLKTEETLAEMTKNLYAVENPYYAIDSLSKPIENGVQNERQPIYEMLASCPNDTVRNDIVKLMSVVVQNENLTVYDVEGYMRTIPLLIDLLKIDALDKHDFANYLADQESIYQLYRQLASDEDPEYWKDQTQNKTALKVVDYIFKDTLEYQRQIPNEFAKQVRSQVYNEYFNELPFVGYDSFFATYSTDDMRMSLMMNDLVSNETVLKAAISGDMTAIKKELYQICPDMEQVDDLLYVSQFQYMDGFLEKIQPFYEAKFQVPVQGMPLWQFYQADETLDDNLTGPVRTRLVKPSYNSELIKNIADPYVEVEFYDAYLGDEKLTVAGYQQFKGIIRNDTSYEDMAVHAVLSDYTMKKTNGRLFHGLYPNTASKGTVPYQKTNK